MQKIPHRFRHMPLLIALGLAGAAFAAASAPQASAPSDGTLLNVSTSGEARHAPNVASLSTEVSSDATDGEAAMAANARKMSRLLQAIRAAGIADKDVRTSSVNLGPQYKYETNKPPRVIGYRASNSLELTMRDIARLGALLDTLAANGASQINGPSFEIDDPEPLYGQAREQALKLAQTRAESYARALGLRVRRIVSIAENGAGNRPMRMMLSASLKDSVETPVQPGENTVSVNLDVVFELGR